MSRRRIRGPKLRVKLLLVAIVLLVVPWLSYIQLVEMERLLVQSQKNAQLLMASSIATLFNNRVDLFNDLPVQIEDYEHLYAHPIEGNIIVDGDETDWGPNLSRQIRSFGEGDGSFDLALGEQSNQLYGLVQVRDSERVYRNPWSIQIDSADHILIKYIDTSDTAQHISLTFTEPGVAIAFQGSPEVDAGKMPFTNIGAFLRETTDGFIVEFVFPLANMGARRDFSVAYVDVDDPTSQQPRAITETIPTSESESFGLVVFRSEETVNLIESLGYVDTRIQVVDNQHRTRGDIDVSDPASDSADDPPRGLLDIFSVLRPFLHRVFIGEEFREPTPQESLSLEQSAIGSALGGEPLAVRRTSSSGSPSILAAHPVQSPGSILGAVVVEQDIEHILSFQQRALEQILLVSLIALFIVIAVALGYSIRLAYRIQKLGSSASRAIDEHGRLTEPSLSVEVNAGDEIGDLARSIRNMLERLSQHQVFLQRMPRTLRHEINNPLNTVSTSLENLRSSTEPAEQERYLQSARRGIDRIGRLVQNLSDAASLEDSLKNEEFSVVNLEELVRNYAENLQSANADIELVYRGGKVPALAHVSDFHIEQMLDKIVDNAIDFHRPDSPIKIQLDQGTKYLRITVANRGPAIPGDLGSLFDSLVSQRSEQSTLHFGLGLYVVRVIAEFHGGKVRAINLKDGSGVAVSVDLPLAQESTSRSSELAA